MSNISISQHFERTGFKLPELVPISLNGGLIQFHDEEDLLGDLKAIRDAMNFANASAEKSLKIARAIHADETKTPVLRHLTAKKEALKIYEAVDRKIWEVAGIVNGHHTKLRKELEGPVLARDTASMLEATSIRDALGRLSSTDRKAAIHSAIDNGDDRVIAAVLSMPAWATGLMQPDLDHARIMWARKRQPHKSKYLDRLDKAWERLMVANETAKQFVGSLFDQKAAEFAEQSEGRVMAALTS
jgi:hypothetical protein